MYKNENMYIYVLELSLSLPIQAARPGHTLSYNDVSIIVVLGLQHKITKL